MHGPLAGFTGSLRLAAAAFALFGAVAQAQTFPTKAIHVVVPLGAGSSTDIIARAIAAEMSQSAGQPVVVENRPGAGGLLGARSVMNSTTDGHTVLMTSSTHLINIHLYKELGFDPIKDFIPVTPLVEFQMYLYVNAASPYKTVEDLIKAGRGKADGLTSASASSTQRLMSERFQQKTQLKLINVPYKATAAALTDLASGGIDMMFTDNASATAQRQAGRVRPIGVGGSKRSGNMPDVPTLQEAGVTGYDMVGSWFGVWVRAGTPPAVVTRLNGLFADAVRKKSVQDVMAASGFDTLLMSPEEFGRFQQKETEMLGSIVAAAGIEKQ